MNVIEEKRDIFYLEVDEILFYIDGKSTTNNLKELIAIRKAQYMKYQNTAPDERFYSYGAVNIGNDFKKEKKSASESSAKVELKGIGASPGIVTGKVRIIKDPTNAKLEQGEILVAEFTDPGWIMLFPAASGILVERGSLLSHSAIVSRELGIPAVVGITGLINSLETGDTVELNGTTGEVKVISKAEDEIVENPYTLKDLLRSTVIKYGDKILYLDRKITFKEFGDNVNALGTALLDLSLEGKKIGIISLLPIVHHIINRYLSVAIESDTIDLFVSPINIPYNWRFLFFIFAFLNINVSVIPNANTTIQKTSIKSKSCRIALITSDCIFITS